MTRESKEEDIHAYISIAAQESMQSFFDNWLKDDKLQKEWHRRKEISKNKITLFLQENVNILSHENKIQKESWIEQSIKNLEELEKAQLEQRFLTATTHYSRDEKKQVITLSQTESASPKKESMESMIAETMIFMPEINQNKNSFLDVTDTLRKGLTNTRAFLNIINLSEKSLNDEKRHVLESHLQTFKQQINSSYQSQKNQSQKNHQSIKSAVKTHEIFLDKLAYMLVQEGLYTKENDAYKGMTHMADFLWSKNYEKPCIYVQHTSQDRTNMMVFEPRSVKGSGNKEALWINKLAKKHPWIKKLPWQVLERPRPSKSMDGEGLKIEKATLVSVKKIEKAEYVVDCTSMGELSGNPIPFAINDLVERYRITLKNQKGIFLGSKTHDDKPPFHKLEEIVSHQMDILAEIMTKERRKKGISIPLADIYLTRHIFSYKKDSIWLKDRANANKTIRKILQRYALYYDEKRMKCEYLDKESENFSALQKKISAACYVPIYTELHESTIFNHPIKVFSYKKNENISGLKASVNIAIERLEIFKEKLLELNLSNKVYQEDIKDIGIVQGFLQKKTIGLRQEKNICNSILSTTRRLSKKLRDTQYLLSDDAKHNRKVQIEILKILQSSLIVKNELSESMCGFLFRTIDHFFIHTLFIAPKNKSLRNFFMTNTLFSKTMWGLLWLFSIPFFIAGWSMRLMFIFSAAMIKIPFAIYDVLQNIIHKNQHKSERLAAAIGILFSTTGKKKLNFRNTVNCVLPVFFMIHAMINRALNTERANGNNVPLMSECNKHTFEKDAANISIQHRQTLK